MGLAAQAHSIRASNWLLVYGSFAVMAEISLALIGPSIATAMHAILLTALAAHSAFSRVPKDPQLPVLMLIPLMRILSLVMPVPEFGPIAAYVLVGIPSLIGVALVIRALGINLRELGLGMPAQPWVSVAAAASGIAIGLVLIGTLGSDRLALIGGPDPLTFLLVGIPFVVVLEEVVFRGLLQHVASIRSPNLAIFIPNVLYAAMYLGGGRGPEAIAMGGVGLILSTFVARTGSLWGALGAHLLMRLVIQYDPGF